LYFIILYNLMWEYISIYIFLIYLLLWNGIYMFVILKMFYVFMLIFWMEIIPYLFLHFKLCVCIGKWNCVFASLKLDIYVSGFDNDYFFLYFNTKLYILCLLMWSCILYFYLIQIPYVSEWLYEWLFMNMCM